VREASHGLINCSGIIVKFKLNVSLKKLRHPQLSRVEQHGMVILATRNATPISSDPFSATILFA
jgi:hypothetical protein